MDKQHEQCGESCALPWGVMLIAGLNIGVSVAMVVAAVQEPGLQESGWIVGAALVQIVVAIGLLALARWAWWAAVFGYSTNVLWALAEGAPYVVIVPAVILVYLLSPGVRKAFWPVVSGAPATKAGISGGYG